MYFLCMNFKTWRYFFKINYCLQSLWKHWECSVSSDVSTGDRCSPNCVVHGPSSSQRVWALTEQGSILGSSLGFMCVHVKKLMNFVSFFFFFWQPGLVKRFRDLHFLYFHSLFSGKFSCNTYCLDEHNTFTFSEKEISGNW